MNKPFRADVQVKTIDVEARTVEYIASTEAVDSYGEVVEQDWILDRFNKNPVILYNHNKSVGGGMFNGSLPPEATLPIGRSVSHGVELSEGKPALKLKVEFAPADVNPFAEQVFGLVRTGFLKGGSVGFNPHSVRLEKRNDVDTYVLSRNELFEFSICPMGANPDAVSLSADDVTTHRALLQSLATRSATQPLETPHMDLEKMLSEAKALAEKTAGELDTARADLAAKSAAVETAEKAVLELTEANKGLAEKLANETKRADSIEADLVAIEVKSLVGSKLSAAEVDDAITDRIRLGKVEFGKRMEKRADLKLLESKTPTSGPASDLSNVIPGQKTAQAIFSPKGAA